MSLQKKGVISVCWSLFLSLLSAPSLADEAKLANPGQLESSAPTTWRPGEPMPKEYDWIMLVSGEWLKGSFTAMYRDVVEFSSEKLDALAINWSDIAIVKTKGPKEVQFTDRSTVYGRLFIKQGQVTVIQGEQNTQYQRADILSIANRGTGFFKPWVGAISLAADIKQGNLSQRDFTLTYSALRRTAKNRYQLGFIGRYGVLEGETTENTRRINTSIDWFFSERWFLRPLQLEYFSDFLQGIDARYTYSTALGYNLVDRKDLTWEAHAGPGYQVTQYDEDEFPERDELTEKTSVGSIGTSFFWDARGNINVDGKYDLQIVSEDAGKYNHHAELGLVIDLLQNFHLNLRCMIDRVEEPEAISDSEQIEKQDTRFMVGIGYSF